MEILRQREAFGIFEAGGKGYFTHSPGGGNVMGIGYSGYSPHHHLHDFGEEAVEQAVEDHYHHLGRTTLPADPGLRTTSRHPHSDPEISGKPEWMMHDEELDFPDPHHSDQRAFDFSDDPWGHEKLREAGRPPIPKPFAHDPFDLDPLDKPRGRPTSQWFGQGYPEKPEPGETQRKASIIEGLLSGPKVLGGTLNW